MKYANAWRCEQCPQSSGEAGCPAWLELIEMNVATGEERVTRQCLFQALPRMLIEVIKAANRPAAEIGQLRADMVGALPALLQPPGKPALGLRREADPA